MVKWCFISHAPVVFLQAVMFIHRTLLQEGYRAVMLHGKRSQAERLAAMADFKAGKAQARPPHYCLHAA